MVDGVAPPALALQGVGEAAEVVEGVWQIKLSVPFPSGFVSVYLVGAEDGWILVDAGYDNPPAREAREAGALRAGCDLSRDVARIVVTHFHPDHVGAAWWLQEVSAAPVSMMKAEIAFARRLWGSPEAEPFVGLLVSHGMPREMAETLAAAMRGGLRLPEEILPLRAEEHGALTVYQQAFALAETLAHLDHLVLEDRVRVWEGLPVAFEAA